ncbi:MAG: DNA polymerase III subunit delta, partial [Hyphomonadaceae bacterium]
MKLTGAAVRRFLEKPDPQLRGALVYGPNRSLVAEAAARLAAHALGGSDDPFAITKLSEEDARKDKARLSDALASQSLLGGPTLVWARLDGESANESVFNALADIEAERPGGFLLIEGGDLSGTGKLAKAFEAAKRAVLMAFYEETEAERAAFADALLKEAGLALAPEARETLAALLPPDRGLMRREIEKLAAFAYRAAAPLKSAEIEALIADEGEGALDAAGLAALAGQPGPAIETLARVDAMNGVSAIKALERRLLRLLDARARVDGGASPPDAMAKLRPPVFWKERDGFLAHLRAWEARRLIAALDILRAAEQRANQA